MFSAWNQRKGEEVNLIASKCTMNVTGTHESSFPSENKGLHDISLDFSSYSAKTP